jgi:mevalonate kinase
MSASNALTVADHAAPAADPGAGVGHAHGKAILLGEHAVVYGAPALAIPLPELTATATVRRFSCPGDGPDEFSFAMAGPGAGPVTPLAVAGLRHLATEFKQRTGVTERICVDVLIDCTIPQGRGLGSSAACARAVVLALADVFGRDLDPAAVFALVQSSETVAHGRASGIDALATGAASPLYFRAGTGRELPMQRSGAVFVIADSGAGGSTKDAVELVRRTFERDPGHRETFIREVSELTHAAVDDLADGRWTDFGERLTANHRLLRDLGISTDPIDALVEAALAGGGLGAKLSGGGLGGCMIALAGDSHTAETVVRKLHRAGAGRTWVVPAERLADHAH